MDNSLENGGIIVQKTFVYRQMSFQYFKTVNEYNKTAYLSRGGPSVLFRF